MLRTQSDLRSHIRTHSRPTVGIPYKTLREAFPGPELATYTENLENDGQILILRSLTGKMKDAPLPPLGRENAWGEKLNAGGPERWRMIFWDELKERNRTVPRVDDGGLGSSLDGSNKPAEMIFAWADVKIEATDDVVKLLEERECGGRVNLRIWLTTFPLCALRLSPVFATSLPTEDLKASSSNAPPPKVEKTQEKKKKKRNRALKITNTHMKQFVSRSGARCAAPLTSSRASTSPRTTKRPASLRSTRTRPWSRPSHVVLPLAGVCLFGNVEVHTTHSAQPCGQGCGPHCFCFPSKFVSFLVVSLVL